MEIARELCQQLGIHKFNLRFVSWIGRMGLRKLPSDYMMIYRDTLWLPMSLMEKLEPDDWRPLLASGLIYYSTYQKKTMVRILTKLFPLILGFPIIIFLYWRIVGIGSAGSQVGSDIIIVAFIGLLIFVTIRWFTGWKRLWLEADDRAIGLLGREAFLRTLEKVQSFGPAKGPPLRLYPSIPERIRHLSETNVAAP